MKKFWKSDNSWWSYGQEFGVLFFLTHSVEMPSLKDSLTTTTVGKCYVTIASYYRRHFLPTFCITKPSIVLSPCAMRHKIWQNSTNTLHPQSHIQDATWQVCVQFPTSAVNVALPSARQQSVDITCLSGAQQQHANDRANWQTDAWPLQRQCSAHHAGSDSKAAVVVIITTHPLNSPLSGTTQVSWYQKGKTNLDFIGARDSEWQWHQLGCMQVCTSLQTDNHASTHHSVFTGQICPSCRPTNSIKVLKA